MKTRTIYVAFDDEEFDTEEDCREYEATKNDCLKEIINAYSFFDKNMEPFTIQQKEFEDSLFALNEALGFSEYIHVKQVPSKEAIDFLREYTDYIMPPKEIGWYKWDYNSNDWVRK